MDIKLFTALEVAVIAGLILAVMYFGGIFDSPPAPTPAIATALKAVQTPTVTRGPTRTPRPTLQSSLTPTAPALVSPTGLIAFETTRDGDAEIYTMQADGSGLTNLTQNPAEDMNFAWSPDGRRIAFFSTRTGWLEIFVMDADGTHLTQITHIEGTNTVYNPPLAWSPDGKSILSIRSRVWGPIQPQNFQTLAIIASDGSGAQTIYENKDEYFWLPASTWSPDNVHIAFAVSTSQNCLTYIAEVGQAQRTFSQLLPFCGSFAWSPDGSQIAYPFDTGITVVTLDGVKQYTVEVISHAYGFINWSPDGQHFLYGNMNGLIDAVSTDGVRRVRLGLDYNSTPGWSPDGQWLAYVDGQQTDIGLLNIYDPSYSVLLTHTNSSYSPQWQPRP